MITPHDSPYLRSNFVKIRKYLFLGIILLVSILSIGIGITVSTFF